MPIARILTLAAVAAALLVTLWLARLATDHLRKRRHDRRRVERDAFLTRMHRTLYVSQQDRR